MHNLNWE